MASKKKTKGDLEGVSRHRPKGLARSRLILNIVMSDSTFSIQFGPDPRYGPWWYGKCIHCNTRLSVRYDGQSEATIEHIDPLCNDGSTDDLKNLALACKRCNSEKGVRHDRHVGKGGRADEVIAALREKRMSRWRVLQAGGLATHEAG